MVVQQRQWEKCGGDSITTMRKVGAMVQFKWITSFLVSYEFELCR